MKINEALGVAKELAAVHRENERGFRDQLTREQHKSDRWHSFFKLALREQRYARALEFILAEKPSGFGLVRQWWANIEYKWSGTVLLRLFSKKDMREDRQAVVPVLVVRDTPAARKALGYKQT